MNFEVCQSIEQALVMIVTRLFSHTGAQAGFQLQTKTTARTEFFQPQQSLAQVVLIGQLAQFTLR